MKIQDDFLPRDVISKMATELSASRLVGENTLAGTFKRSKGFGFCFTAEGINKLGKKCPEVMPFFNKLESHCPSRKFLPWHQRFFSSQRKPNAFYLNYLVLSDGDAIGPHVDATLTCNIGHEKINPLCVSVLYLELPKTLGGGQLKIYGAKPRIVAPKIGRCVHFDGGATHEILKITSANSGFRRASLICEQYHLPDEALAKVQPFKLYSRGLFKSYLRH